MSPMAAQIRDTTYDHHKGMAPLLRPTSRWRSGLFLLVNLAAFALINAFWQYLATGRWINFSIEAYRHDLAKPLTEIFLKPLGIFTHPWMILVTGLLLALVIFVPVIVAVLYRLPFAAVFVAVVVVIGHAPVLALTLALGCMLAARTPMRSDMPFLAALLGLLLPATLCIAVSLYVGAGAAVLQPIQRWLLCVPPLLAVVAATIASAVVLALAQATSFRPGVVWPVLAIMLAGPMLVFFTKIGAGELDYALIANDLAPGNTIFSASLRDEWSRANRGVGLDDDKLLARAKRLLRDRTQKLAARCDAFLVRHGKSKHAASIAWLKAQCLCLQIDEQAFGKGLVKYSARHTLEASTKAWQFLSDNYAASPQAALADWRLAELKIRQLAKPDATLSGAEKKRLLNKADALLLAAAQRLRSLGAEDTYRRAYAPTGEVFRRAHSVPSRQYYGRALLAVERLIWLIEQNGVLQDINAAEALAGYLNANPMRTDYYAQIKKLLDDPTRRFEKTKMEDNLRLAYALATDNLYERADMLVLLAKELNDAAIEANYELGQLVLQQPELQLKAEVEDSQLYFKRVKSAPFNPYTKAATERLRWLSTPKEDKKQP